MSKKLLFALALVGFSLTACTPDALPDSPEIPEQMMEDDTDSMMKEDVMLDVDSEELGGDPNEQDEDDAMMEDDSMMKDEGTTDGY